MFSSFLSIYGVIGVASFSLFEEVSISRFRVGNHLRPSSSKPRVFVCVVFLSVYGLLHIFHSTSDYRERKRD